MKIPERTGSTSCGSDDNAIHVFVRVRPPFTAEAEFDHGMCAQVDETHNSVIMHCKPEPKVFTFDHVADTSTTQEAVFSSVGRSIIESCVDGYNGTIFAYGQTGSGKTFTMLGPSEESEDFRHELRGVIPRGFEYLFNRIKQEQELHGDRKTFLCRCSFLEIYYEQVYDLLDPTSPSLQVRENMKKGVFVDGITEHTVSNPSEAYQVLNIGWMNRKVAATAMNRESSRSHAVFTLHIESKSTEGGVQNIRGANLNLVDLAGSERQKDTATVGLRLKEASSINKSLSTLGNVIMALGDIAHGRSRHVPYRDSKLTFLLKDSLGGNAKTSIIACIHPGSKCFSETLSTLQFARRAKLIKNKATINEDTFGNVLHLQAEIRQLRESLRKYETGEVPSGLDPNTLAVCQRPASGPDDVEWRMRFVQAMLLCEREAEKTQALNETLAQVQNLSEKKDKTIQSLKMIIKFRDSRIAALDKGALQDDNSLQAQISSLQTENKHLKEQLDSELAAAKYAADNQRLRGENKVLRSQSAAICDSGEEIRKITELEKLYDELHGAQQNGDNETVSTPCRSPRGTVGSVADKRAQVAKLQNEITELKRQLEEDSETAKKHQIELDAEIVSQKTTIKELESALQARNIKHSIERQMFSDRHVNTIKSITTPTRVCYALRNRVILNSENDSPGVFSGNGAVEEEFLNQSGVMDETLPPEVSQCLINDITGLQETNNSLQRQLEDLDSERIRNKQELTRLAYQTELLNQQLVSEKTLWSQTEMQLKEEVSSLQEELTAAADDARVCREEAEDLRIVLSTTDKKVADSQKQSLHDKEHRDKEIASMDTKLLQFELALAELQRDNESLIEERTVMQESLETAQATASYNEEQVQNLEKILQTNISRIEDLESQIVKLHEREMQENCQVATERLGLQAAIDSHVETIGKLEAELETNRTAVNSQHKALQDNKEMISSLMVKMQETKEQYLSLEQLNLSLSDELDGQRLETQIVHELYDDQVVQAEALREQLSQITDQMEMRKSAHNVELCVMQEDIEYRQEISDKLQTDVNEAQSKLKEIQAEKDRLIIDLENSKEEISKREKTIASLHQTAEERVAPKEEEIAELCDILDTKNCEIESLKTSLGQLQHLLEDGECRWQEKHEEVNGIKSRLGDCDSERFRLENETDALRRDNFHLNERCHEMKVDLNKLIDERTEEVASLSAERSMNEQLKIRIASVESHEKENLKLAEGNAAEVLRLQALIAGHQQEVIRFISENQQLQEENKNITDQLQKVTDENAHLVGHHNHKQRIQYHMAMKEENANLKELLAKQTSLLQHNVNRPHTANGSDVDVMLKL